MVRRLTALDTGFLVLENERQPLHVGALLVLDGPGPDDGMVRDELIRRAGGVPACRQVVHASWGGLRRPVWVDDAADDLAAHVHRVACPGPGDRMALRRKVVELMRTRLDRSRPLWEVTRIDDLQDGSWALLAKAHHSMVDGVSGASLLGALLTPDGGGVVPGRRTAGAATPLVGGRLSRLGRLRQGVRTVAVADLPPSPLNGPLGAHRSWDWVTVDLADLRAVAHAASCTINDVYLAALCGALHDLLPATSGDQQSRVRVLVPVSMRTGADDTREGNLDAAIFVELPVELGSVRAMLDRIAAQTAGARAAGVPLATEALVRAGDFVPAPMLAAAARAYTRRGQGRVNLVASDVIGPTSSMELCGCRVREVVPCLPLALDVRMTSALMSYAGDAAITVTTDLAALPDAEVLTARIVAALEQLRRGD